MAGQEFLNYNNYQDTSPVYIEAAASDTVDLPNGACRALLIAVGGSLKVRRLDNTDITLSAVPAGLFPCVVKRVWSTGTAATGITCLY